MKPYDRQQPWHNVCIHPPDSRPRFKRTARSPLWLTIDWGKRSQPKRACAATPLSSPNSHTTSYNTDRSQLPSCGALRSVSTLVDARCREMRQSTTSDERQRSIQIRKTLVPAAVRLNLDNALLIPCASLLTVSRTINFLFKVLFIFPSRYLFAIGLVPIFSFRRSLPPILGCITKQPDSQKTHRERCTVPRTGLSPSTMCRSKQLKHCAFALKTNL